ncbi:hypothetical protein [Halorussus caseinilyticus]|uniref:Uncharacterized protein n=1 Tax=Halorussus caseinilyticus TaxID=3034025 RepID=A0ABD5WIH6_9EURY
MRYTQYTPERLTRTTLRDAATRPLDAAEGYVPTAAVALAAAATFAAAATAITLSLALVLTTLHAHPAALLAVGATAVVAPAALPCWRSTRPARSSGGSTDGANRPRRLPDAVSPVSPGRPISVGPACLVRPLSSTCGPIGSCYAG